MKIARILILLVLILGTFLRFYHIDKQSLWYDEGNSAQMTERSASEIVTAAAGDIHPPGYYLALDTWSTLLGQSEWSLRALSAMAGIIMISMIYHIGYRCFSAKVGLVAALITSVHPALVYYSQEARMYMLAATLGTAVFALTFHLFPIHGGRSGQSGDHNQKTTGSLHSKLYVRSIRNHTLKAGYMLTAAGGLYTHYSFPFVLIAANLSMLWQAATHRQHIKTWLTVWLPLQVGALLLFTPWIPTAVHHVTNWPAAKEYMPWQEAVTEIWRWLILGLTSGNSATSIPSLTIYAILALVGLLHRHITPILIWMMVPTVLTVAFGLFSESFAKFLLLAVPSVTLLTACGAITLWEGRMSGLTIPIRRSLLIILAIPMIWSTFMSLENMYNNPAYYRDDYRSLASDLESANTAGDAILLHSPNQWEVFTYYYPDTPDIIRLARVRPLDVQEQISELVSLASKYQRLFVIFWGDSQPDPEGVVEGWLNQHTFKTDERWYGSVRLATYSSQLNNNETSTTVNAQFGDSIVLESYSLASTIFHPGDIVQLSLLWTTTSPLNTRYKVFVHIYDDMTTPPIAQHDSSPVGGLRPTSTWIPGETVVDNHGVMLPINLSPRHYQVLVGLYNSETGARLQPILNNPENIDYLRLGEISVAGQNP